LIENLRENPVFCADSMNFERIFTDSNEFLRGFAQLLNTRAPILFKFAHCKQYATNPRKEKNGRQEKESNQEEGC
jgi:hypothetical protein